MALALYRKYRPATFAEVVGQEHVTGPLVNAVDGGRINHAYLFSGPRGCGKTSSARILARSLNCEQGPTANPCGVCGSCVALAPDGPGSLDVIEIDAASHGGVDDARDLRERAFFAPVNSRYKVYIVDEAHMVTTQGFNALLKVVEEPPEFLVFVFATTEPEKVLPTIRSRTHHYPFRLVPPTTLRGLLEKTCAAEGVTVEPTVFPLVVRAGGGSVRDSLSILDQLLAWAGPEGVTYKGAVGLLGVTDDALLDETIDALAAHDAPAVFRAVDRVVEAGHDPRRFATDLLERLRDLIVLDAVPRRRRQRPARLPARPARPDEPAGQGPRLGHAVADGRHRARGPHRDAGDDGAAPAAGARLRPHAAARPPTGRRPRPCSASSGSSGGCPSRASTPAARPMPRPARPPRPRAAGPRPSRPARRRSGTGRARTGRPRTGRGGRRCARPGDAEAREPRPGHRSTSGRPSAAPSRRPPRSRPPPPPQRAATTGRRRSSPDRAAGRPPRPRPRRPAGRRRSPTSRCPPSRPTTRTTRTPRSRPTYAPRPTAPTRRRGARRHPRAAPRAPRPNPRPPPGR